MSTAVPPNATGMLRGSRLLLGCVALAVVAGPHLLAAQASCATDEAIAITSLIRTEAQLAPSEGRLPQGATALSELACTRWQLWRRGAIARQRPGMPLGASWLEGAAAAAWAGLETSEHSDDIAAIIAALAITEPVRLTTDGRFERVVSARARGPWSDSATLSLDRTCIALGERLPERATKALACAREGKSLDPASAPWWLAESRFLAFRQQPADAWQAWTSGIQRLRTVADWQPVLDELRWFATPEELEAVRSASDESRAIIVKSLFDRRDLAVGQPQGTYLVTHYNRVAQARQEFALRIPNGQKSRFTSAAPTSGKSAETVTDSGRLGEADWRELVRWQSEIDDRGVMFVRHGAPDVRVAPVSPGRAIELWAYLRSDPPLFFQFEEEDFDGSVAPTRLTAGRWGEQWCGLDVFRCVLGMRGDATPEQRQRLLEQDRDILARAMGTDTPADSVNAPLTLAAQAHRLWDPGSENPILFVAYVLPWPDGAVDGPLKARLELASWGAINRDTTLERIHPAPADHASGRPVHAVGFVTAGRDSLTTAWRLEAITGQMVRRAVGTDVQLETHDGVSRSPTW